MYVPARMARMTIEGLWCMSVSVSKPSKGRGATELSSSGSNSIARVCVSKCVCVKGWRGEERQTRRDSREKERESGSRPSLSPPQQENQDPRTRQDL